MVEEMEIKDLKKLLEGLKKKVYTKIIDVKFWGFGSVEFHGEINSKDIIKKVESLFKPYDLPYSLSKAKVTQGGNKIIFTTTITHPIQRRETRMHPVTKERVETGQWESGEHSKNIKVIVHKS